MAGLIRICSCGDGLMIRSAITTIYPVCECSKRQHHFEISLLLTALSVVGTTHDNILYDPQIVLHVVESADVFFIKKEIIILAVYSTTVQLI